MLVITVGSNITVTRGEKYPFHVRFDLTVTHPSAQHFDLYVERKFCCKLNVDYDGHILTSNQRQVWENFSTLYRETEQFRDLGAQTCERVLNPWLGYSLLYIQNAFRGRNVEEFFSLEHVWKN